MFGIVQFYQGKLLAVVFALLLLCCAACYDTNKDIRKIDDDPDREGHLHLAPFSLLVIATILVFVSLILPLSVE